MLYVWLTVVAGYLVCPALSCVRQLAMLPRKVMNSVVSVRLFPLQLLNQLTCDRYFKFARVEVIPRPDDVNCS